MKKTPAFLPFGICLVLVGVLAGCATDRGIHHFPPAPMARVGTEDLEPAKPKLVSELLRSAQEEFEAANAEQEKGERDAALQHYAKMLDLLKEAELDPGAFYNLRAEFQRIVAISVPEPPSDESQPAARANRAEEAFEAANTAQEQGDREAALRHYTKMLEVLAKNNADPGTLYSLRGEFQRILDTSEKQAALYDRQRVNQWKAGHHGLPVVGDIAIEYPISDRVRAEIEEIQQLYPKNFQWGLDRSFKYLPYVQSEFARAGLPKDLVWLAMVESQFTPKVVSRAGAAGMWQFMRQTGGRYGLRVDSYVDDRFNWQKSTQGAAQYLSELRDRFDGSWPLAVSAYNMGEGGLERAIASAGGERNLWKLIETPPACDCIMQETKKFYPKLLASIIVAKDPERFGFTSNPQPPEELARVTVRGSYSLAALDKACGLPEGTLRQLNPDLIRGVTPPGREYGIAVPPEAGSRLASALSDLPQIKPDILRALDKKRSHTVKRGETVELIARKYGVPVNDLLEVNRIRTASRVTPGKKLMIPPLTGDIDSIQLPGPEKPGAQKAGEDVQKKGGKNFARNAEPATYTVKPGDTLAEIAKRQQVSLKNLLIWNKLKQNSLLHVGDQLKLNTLEEMSEPKEEPKTTHVVQSGESPAKIAKLYGVNLDDLLEWNNLSKVSTIDIGDKLMVKGIQEDKNQDAGQKEDPKADSGKGASNQPKGTKKMVHTVAKGECPDGIAAKYGVPVDDFLAWNKLTAKSIIQPGEQRTVYIKDDSPKKPDAKVAKVESKTEKPKAPEKVAAKAEKPQAKAAESKTTTHVVAKGETPSSIAGKYKVKISDLYKWNNWGKNVVLQIGQKVSIQK